MNFSAAYLIRNGDGMKKITKSKQEQGKYVYCIIKSCGESKSFGNIGFGDEEVYTIDYKEFSPIISVAPLKNYQIDNDDEIEIHTKVVKSIMKEHSVIPVAYGMVFKNRILINAAMKAGNKAMKKALTIVENKVELGVKVIVPKEQENYEKTEQCKQEFMEDLKKIAFDSKDLKLFSKHLILNTSFLVEKDKISSFSDEIAELKNKYDNLKIRFLHLRYKVHLC